MISKAKTLIIGDHLLMAGAEKLIYELVVFCRANDIEPIILIVNNYTVEYYDAIFKNMGVQVVRTTLSGIRKLKNPANIIRALKWRQILKRNANKTFTSVQVIGLYNVHKVINTISHPNRMFWHVSNAAQYENHTYPFEVTIFKNPADKIICINKYQVDELKNQYGTENIKPEMQLFKLFLNT